VGRSLHGGDFGVEQLVVRGGFAHLGFQPSDFVVPFIALAVLSKPKPRLRPRQSVSLAGNRSDLGRTSDAERQQRCNDDDIDR